MGYDITPQQKQSIRLTLNIDGEGRVVFLEFVKLAKEMFAFRLDDAQLETSLVYALTRKDSLELPIFPKKVCFVSFYMQRLIRVLYSILILLHSGHQL